MDSLHESTPSPSAAIEPGPAPTHSDSPAEAAAMGPICAIDPDFRSFSDLAAMPEAEAFNRLVLKGNTLTDAFRLARQDALVSRRAAEASRSALSRAHNRSHLTASGGGGRAEPVPPETMELYRQLCPGLSDEAYRAHYVRSTRSAL